MNEAIRLVHLRSDSGAAPDASPGVRVLAARNPDVDGLAAIDGCEGFVVDATSSEDAIRWLTALGIAHPGLPRIVVIRSGDAEWVDVAAEADDCVHAPWTWDEVRFRHSACLQLAQKRAYLRRAKNDAEVMVELTQALSSSLDFRDILFTVVRRIAEVADVARASVIVAPESDERDAYVVATSDDAALSNLRIDLGNYPEIRRVLDSGEQLVITDIASDPIYDDVRAALEGKSLGARTLLPIRYRDQVIGVLFLRSERAGQRLDNARIRLCQTIANATAVALRNARVMQSLRDHSQRITFARFEAEQRINELHRYADTFTSAAEGIAVIARDGHLLFANPRAFEIVGASPDDHAGAKVKDLVHEDDKQRLQDIWNGLAEGTFPRGVDVRIVRADSGEVRTCTVSFSSLADAPESALLTFQDVSEQRATEAELVKTMEFLESLIEASVDGIVAADLEGQLLLFNGGAERIYGYSTEEALSTLTTRSLYPPGEAEAIMRRIRSADFGGVGRLAASNVMACAKDGEQVPIRLSAAMIYEGGVPTATFGIFTDLRDRMRVEARLAEAQQQLELTEKHALVAELAGTAAHELNQPLTSVMAYAELLARKLEDGTPEHRAAKVMYREADRMADIVRKIGQMTRYETKSYVGQQRILDLDKASGERGADSSSGAD
ncbi:MAG: PAS domain S-box protein [Myxococcota bacterium]